jgi:hypothetical protein
MIEKLPLPIWAAAKAVAGCAVNTAVLTAQRRLHLSKDHVGDVLQFADGTTSGSTGRRWSIGHRPQIPLRWWLVSDCVSCAAEAMPCSAP